MAAFDRRVEASPANRTEVLLYHVANGYYELRNFLLHHVIGDSLSRDQIATDDFIPTLSQGVLIVEVEDGIATVSGANFVETNIELENGTLHVIDTVLNP